MANRPDVTVNSRQIAERIWRARNQILCFQLATIALTLLVILFWPRTYSSTARLYLQRGRESVGLDPTASTGKTIALQQAGRDSEINSAIDVLSSRGIIDPVVEKLGPAVVKGDEPVNPSAAGRKPSAIASAIKGSIGWLADQVRKVDPASYKERAVVEIEKNLVVDAERKSEIISVVYEAETPELAQAVVDAIVEEYKIKHSELHRTLGSTEFFDEQSERLREELARRSSLLRDAKNRMGLTTIQGQRRILEDVQLGEIRLDMLNTDKSLHGARAKARNLAERLASLPERISAAETTKPSYGSDLNSKVLYELQIKLIDAKSKFRDSHPVVRSLVDQVAEAKKQHAAQNERVRESTDNVNPVHEKLSLQFATVEAEVAGWEARKSKLAGQEAKILEEMKQLNAFEGELAKLQLDVDVAVRKYQTYTESLEEARVDQAMKKGAISSVSIAQQATFQEKPVSPSKPLVAVCGALLCIIGPILIAFLRVLSDDTLISKQAASESLGVPVLGVIPQARAFANVNV